MKLLFIGAGYVGLVSAACMAEMGHQVICLDVDEKKIAQLLEGVLPIYESGLQELVVQNLEAGRLTFTTSHSEGLSCAEVCFIAVPTPQAEDGSCDLTYVLSTAQAMKPYLNEKTIIAVKSTVPVGTTEELQAFLGVDVVANPEFLKEGSAVQDCMRPDRIVVGADNPRTIPVMRALYAPFMLSRERILFMSSRSAEFAKYAANAMLATRISFMNEMAQLCERLGVNIHEVRTGIGTDSRIGHQFLYSGIGYGGSCFPKDLQALRKMGQSAGVETSLINAVDYVNTRQRELFVRKIREYFSLQGGLEGKVVAVWGLTFKPGTDDLRAAPALGIMEMLLNEGASLRLFDPIAMDQARRLFSHESKIYFACSEYEAAAQSHAIALMTEWKQFRVVDFARVRPFMLGRAFFDGRNQYVPQEMRERGFDYYAVGIPNPAT